MAFDRYSGDPRLILTENGSTLQYQGGQPVMDQGFENCSMISLLTSKGWCGNIFLPTINQIGSDYEEIARRPITLSGLADTENSAVRAMSSKVFGAVSAEASNPSGDQLSVNIQIGSGGSLSLTREKALWSAQANNPASRRLQ